MAQRSLERGRQNGRGQSAQQRVAADQADRSFDIGSQIAIVTKHIDLIAQHSVHGF